MNKIKITFPDNTVKEFESGITGYQIAQSISNRLADEVLAVKLNGEIKDLYRPIKEDGSVKFLTFDDPEGKEVYWHSSSHLMAHAVQQIFPEAKFGVGPAIDAGFYYDIDINTPLTEDHLKLIEDKMIELSKTDSRFEREELSKQDAIEFFKKKGDQYKVELLS
jgi:threonyl-tRNA synthetase